MLVRSLEPFLVVEPGTGQVTSQPRAPDPNVELGLIAPLRGMLS